MVVIVVSFNLGIACLCLGAVWKLRQWQRVLKRWTKALIAAEQNTDRVLYRAPYYIFLGQSSTQQFHQQISSLSPLRQQFLRVSALVGLLQWVRGYQSSRLRPTGPRANRFKRE